MSVGHSKTTAETKKVFVAEIVRFRGHSARVRSLTTSATAMRTRHADCRSLLSCMRWLSVALLLLCLVGCGGASTAQHDDDEEHHHIPAHRPRDLAAAVVQLEERPAALLKAIDSKDGNVETLFSELRDIVRWVPEIAADSDMKKQPWDEVHTAAQKLEELLPQNAAAFSELKAGSTQEAEWRRLVGQLKQLAPIEAKKSEPEM